MGLLSGVLGHASELEISEATKELNHILMDGEKIERAYKLIRDLFVFTDKRLIMVDKQGITGKKVDYHTVPYKSIIHFSVETAGNFDLDSELKIWLAGAPLPIAKDFKNDQSIIDIQKTLAKYVVG